MRTQFAFAAVLATGAYPGGYCGAAGGFELLGVKTCCHKDAADASFYASVCVPPSSPSTPLFIVPELKEFGLSEGVTPLLEYGCQCLHVDGAERCGCLEKGTPLDDAHMGKFEKHFRRREAARRRMMVDKQEL